MTRDKLTSLKVGTKIVLIEGIDRLQGTIKVGDWRCNTILGAVSGAGKFVEWESVPNLQQPLDLIHEEEIFNIEKLDELVNGNFFLDDDL